MSEGLVREVHQLRKKHYLYKEKGGGLLVSAGKVVDEKYGSAISTFRKEQIEKSRFPTDFWT